MNLAQTIKDAIGRDYDGECHLTEECAVELLKQLQDLSNLRRISKRVWNHWCEFGPEHGFEETIGFLGLLLK